MNYPKTKRGNIVEEIHGKKVEDPYRWLEKVFDPEVQKWVNEQNIFTKEILNQIPNHDKSLERMREFLSLASPFAPTMKGDFLFFRKRLGSENQPVLYVQKGIDGKPKELVNPNKLSEKGLVALDWYHPSPNGKLLAYGLSKDGDEWSVLHIVNVATGEILPDKIPRTRFCSIAWLPDESAFYYTRFPEPGTVPEGQENYNRHVYLHKIGTDWHNDPKIYGEGKPPTDIPIITLSDDGRYLLIKIHKYVKNDIYIMDLRDDNKITTVIENEEILASGVIFGDYLWLLTNYNAPNKAVYRTKLNNPKKENWELIIPENKDIIEEVLVTKEKIILNVMPNATNQLKLYSLDGELIKEIELFAFSSIDVFGPREGIEATDLSEFFFSLKSFFHPTIIYKYNFEKDELSKFDEVKSPLNPEDYKAQQVWYESKDGTKVSMFLVHKKGVKLDGRNPTMLCGYGGFNIPIKPPYLRYSRFFWLEKGGVIAIANLRGGSEYGEEWHKGGMLENKQNVFDDFIYAGKWLIENKYASPETLGIYGRSNGGLLVGAAVTQQPDLFGAVYCGVPLLDMIRYHHFRIARFWIPEYGSSEDSEQFKYLYAYSPYHRVKIGTKYPATFLVTAESDSRVDASHAMKMAALMQWASTSDEPIILYIEKQAGHGVGKPLEKLVESETDLYTFLGWKLGLTM